MYRLSYCSTVSPVLCVTVTSVGSVGIQLDQILSYFMTIVGGHAEMLIHVVFSRLCMM